MTDVQGDHVQSQQCGIGQLTIMFIAVAAVAFLAGYVAGNRRSDQRCYQSGRQQMLEFLTVAADLDIIDMQRLREVVCTASESEGEDDGDFTNEAVCSTSNTAGVEQDEGRQ